MTNEKALTIRFIKSGGKGARAACSDAVNIGDFCRLGMREKDMLRDTRFYKNSAVGTLSKIISQIRQGIHRDERIRQARNVKVTRTGSCSRYLTRVGSSSL